MSDKEEHELRCGESSRGPLLNTVFHCDLGAMLLPSCYPGFGLRLRSVVSFSVSFYCSFALSRSDSEEGSAHAEGR
jgi:hypothetical protein